MNCCSRNIFPPVQSSHSSAQFIPVQTNFHPSKRRVDGWLAKCLAVVLSGPAAFLCFKSANGSLHFILPQIWYGFEVLPFVNVLQILLICFAWIVVQFVKISFPPFPYLCWFCEYSAVLVSDHP